MDYFWPAFFLFYSNLKNPKRPVFGVKLNLIIRYIFKYIFKYIYKIWLNLTLEEVIHRGIKTT